MGRLLLWLVWIIELVIFIAGAGCALMVLSSGDMGYGSPKIGALVLLLGSLALCGYGVFKAAQTMTGEWNANRLALYMLMPVAAVFVFFGGCVVFINS